VFTEANIDEATFCEVDGCVKTLYDLASNNPNDPEAGDIRADIIAGEIELVVQLEVAQDKVSCRYYFVDHRFRKLFWLPMDNHHEAAENLFSALQGVYDLSHMGASYRTHDAADMNQPAGYALEHEYWFVICSCMGFIYFSQDQF
jgi:hypothetical protein